jgi:hypothetical protein
MMPKHSTVVQDATFVRRPFLRAGKHNRLSPSTVLPPTTPLLEKGAEGCEHEHRGGDKLVTYDSRPASIKILFIVEYSWAIARILLSPPPRTQSQF